MACDGCNPHTARHLAGDVKLLLCEGGRVMLKGVAVVLAGCVLVVGCGGDDGSNAAG